MERTIEQFYFQAVHRETTQNTILHRTLETFLYGRNEFFRNITASHLVLELQAAFFVVLIYRTYVYDNIGKLTTTSGLFLVHLTQVDCLRNSLLVIHLRFTLVAFYLKLTFQTVDNNIQMQLTHTGNYRLASLLVSLHSECRIFFGQLCQTVRQLVQVFLRFRLYRNTDNRIREVHRLQYDRSILIAQSITRTDILETDTGTDITGTDNFNRILMI